MSGEHLVSRALFPNGVAVRGFPWCGNEVKMLGANALTARVLCTKHNSMLSALDSAAKDVWCVLRYVGVLNSEWEQRRVAGLGRHQSKVKFQLNGLAFERWAFKTAINMVASGNRPGFVTDWQPPEELLRHIFEKDALPPACGLGMAVIMGEHLGDSDHLSFDLLRQIDAPADRPEVEGFLLGFRGLRLAGSSKTPLASLHMPTNLINPEVIVLRPHRLEFNPTSRVEFSWDGRQPVDDRNVRRARADFDKAQAAAQVRKMQS